MKIGILTYPLNNNYGCYMQSYALMKFLKDSGCDVEYIHRRHDKPSYRFYVKFAILRTLKNILKFEWKSPIYNYEWEYMLKKGMNLISFFENNIVPHTRPIYTKNKLSKLCKKYDVIIVGSDQVWRAEILSNIDDYFLSFLGDRNVKRISYAASFGKSNPGYSLSQISKCGKAIKKFTAVSVRENVGKDIISRYGWQCPPPKVVLDPTMLLDKSDYLSLIDEKDEEETVLGYILDQTDEKKKILSQVANILDINECNFLKDVKLNNYLYPTIQKWLGMLFKSKFVVTDSFHGAVFSVIFNRPFVVLLNKDRGAARFETLLKITGLEDRILHPNNSLEDIVQKPINWELVNDKIMRERNSSIDFLNKALI